MATVRYAREQQGFRSLAGVNPSWGRNAPLTGISPPWLRNAPLAGLGSGNICLDATENSVPCSDPTCIYGDCGGIGPQVTQGPLCLDESENQVRCSDPTCRYGDCIQVKPATGIPQAGPSVAAGVPTGSVLLYQATVSASALSSESSIVSGIAGSLAANGLQVVGQSTGSAAGLGNFTIQLQLQVTGSGFGRSQDVQAIADHAVYVQTGKLPLASQIQIQSTPGTPGVVTPPGSLNTLGFSSWFQQNAVLIGALILAVAVVPPLIKKL